MGLTQTRTRNGQQYIVFTGPSQSGKSTGAALLVSIFHRRGRSAVQCSFEGPMKHYLATLFGRRLEDFKMDDPLSELLSKTPRDFLRLEAAHMRFNYGPGVMGALLKKRVRSVNDYVIVDDGVSVLDCRALGRYYLISIVRSKTERVYPFVIPNADIYVHNDGTHDDLRQAMDKVATAIEGGPRR